MSRSTAYAPGRVEILGNHTDYNGGVVLAGAIDRGITVTGESRDDGVINLTSRTLQRRVEVSVADIRQQTEERWADYPLGVARDLIREGHRVGGFAATINGDLALGGGLSSSAALEVATAYFLLKLQGEAIPPLEVARLCRRAENEFVGVASGMLDQITSVFGRADHVVYLDCRTEEVRTIPFASDVALVIADSGTKHSLLQSQYNQRRSECAAAAKALGVPNLRSVSMEQLQAARNRLDEVLFRRALHVVGENARVWQAVEHLESGDTFSVGELMNASHESSRTNFENSTPELDLLVTIARSLRGVRGARLTGGGFGGSTVTLVDAARADDVAKELTAEYQKQTSNDAHAFVCRLADGAAIVNAAT